MIEELPSRSARLPLHPRARAAGALRPAVAAAAGRAAPPRRRGARGRRRAAPTARSPTSPTTSRAAAPFGGAERAIEYNLRAARAASAALAFDEAAVRLRTALELGIEDEPERAEALLELGTASHRAGKATDALEAFASAAEIARAAGQTRSCSPAPRSATRTPAGAPGSPSRDAVELLEEAARRRSAKASSELRIGLLAGLARALDFQGDHERGAIVRENAVAMARRLEDRAGLATVLMRSYWARGTTPLEEILAMLTEARDLAEELGDAEIRTEAMAWRVPTFVALGDLESARREVAALREMAEQTAQPFMHPRRRALRLGDRSLRRAPRRGGGAGGALARVEPAADRARRIGRLRDPDVRRPSRAGAAGRARAGGQDPGAARPSGTALATRARRAARRARDGARGAGASSARLAAEGLEGFRDSLWLATLTYLTDACAAVGDETMAAIVYPELEPLAGANVMIGHLVACYGAADRYLGMLAATLGEPGRAEEHFELALELNRRMGASTWLAHTAYEYGRFLLGRGRGDRDRAEALLGEAAIAGRANRHAGAARQDPRARGPRRRRSTFPTGSRPARRRSCALVADGPQQPRDRRGALDQRAHRRQPRPQHPAQDRVREPHRGRVLRPPARACLGLSGNPRYDQCDAAVRDRAQLRRAARSHRRRRRADRGDQRRTRACAGSSRS